MRIALGNDHAGYPLKEYVRTVLEDLGHDVIDRGAPSEAPVDFPDITFATCDADAAAAWSKQRCRRSQVAINHHHQHPMHLDCSRGVSTR